MENRGEPIGERLKERARRASCVLLVAGALLTFTGSQTGMLLCSAAAPGGEGSRRMPEPVNILETVDPEPAGIKLYAQSAVLMDGNTGRVLWSKDGDRKRPNASTTKIMTCILALEWLREQGGLETNREKLIVTASRNAAAQPQVHLGMQTGQRFYFLDLLYSLMLESHNDSAVAVAEAVSGSVERFADKMNEKARQIGCTQTTFLTPNGLDRKQKDDQGEEWFHGTSAEDLARIMSYCVTTSECAEEFRKLTTTMDHTFRDADGKRSYTLTNHNRLLSMMDGVLSGKTGFTGAAGYCYTAAVNSEGRLFVLSLLGCGWPPHKTYKWSDVRELMAYARANFRIRDLKRVQGLKGVEVVNGIGDEEFPWREAVTVPAVDLKAVEESGIPVLAGDKEPVEILVNMPERLAAPIDQGERLGTLEYRLGGQLIAACPIRAQEEIPGFTFSWCLEKLLCRMLPGTE